MLARRSVVATGWILLVASLMVLPSPARGQEALALDRLLERLQSPDWLTRAKAAESLDRLLDTDPTLRALPAVQDAVAALLERENEVIRDNVRGGIDTSEAFGSYYDSDVFGTASKLLPETTPTIRPRMLAALVNSSYNSDSPFVKDLALLPRALRAGLQDSDATCRRAAIDAIVVARDRDAIPLLWLLAQSDPDNASGKRARFSVRTLATNAIKTLQQH